MELAETQACHWILVFQELSICTLHLGKEPTTLKAFTVEGMPLTRCHDFGTYNQDMS